tara:strand:- start:927 stop:1106 length:180 start_codon:yes stop_codon:yes gene_type:complete
MEPVPYLDKTFIDYLETLYPDRAPDISMDEKLIWFNSGQVAVVRHLKEMYNQQEESKYN